MARLPKLEKKHLSQEQQAVYEAIVTGPRGAVQGPLEVWLHRPELAQKAQELGRYCRYNSSLPPRLSELAILVTARVWQSEFEWQSHEPAAREAGLADAVIEALANDTIPEFQQLDEAVVYRFAQELSTKRNVDDKLYQQAEKELGREGLIDLVGILGYYSLISMTINAFKVDPLPQ